MRVAVLPFSAAEGVPPALGRQFSAFICDTLRGATGADINPLNFLAQLSDQPGKVAFVNLGESLIELQQLTPMFEQIQANLSMDAVVKPNGDGYAFSVRFVHRDRPDQPVLEEHSGSKQEIFQILHTLIKRLADEAQLMLPPELAGDSLQYGTEDADVFIKFLEGYDAFIYIRQANGMVAQEFDPATAFNLLLEAVAADKEFDGPYQTICELARLCAQYRIGKFVVLEESLQKLAQIVPEDFRAWFVLAEIHMSIGEAAEASEYYEKAIQLEPEDPALYTRLGLAQMQQSMPVNAERNFRKALEREGDDKPSLDYLASVLVQTNRGHEVPTLWKEQIDRNPNDAGAHAKYGYALIQSGRQEEGSKAFDHALETLEDKTVVKRYYAPLLAQQGEYDRAMDFYEDCLDVMPTDIPLMREYAETLDKAGRSFEVPPVLRNIMNAGPDPNTKGWAMGWLIELEQPKRVEAVQAASEKAEAGDHEGAIRDLKPLRNWLTDYWKLWAVLAHSLNQSGQHEEAEEAAGRLINLFPGYEPGYGELMHALSAQEKHDQAYNAMKWAAMNMPNSLPIHLNFGLAAKRAGHQDEARALAAQVREALGANPELEPVLTEIES